ncbi:MAG: helix-turn-helix domain-containing protein [Pseudobdellovibrio sp.]
MARSFVYIVSENPEVVEKVKKSCEGQDVTFFNYSGPQWREGLDNQFFRSQLVNGVPSLAPGLTAFPHPESSGNVVTFPQGGVSTPEKVQKMEDMEARAIEAAIFQYKGNLTEAAKALGIGRATLYRKVKQYHIDPSQARRRKLVAA